MDIWASNVTSMFESHRETNKTEKQSTRAEVKFPIMSNHGATVQYRGKQIQSSIQKQPGAISTIHTPFIFIQTVEAFVAIGSNSFVS
ncbi:hypothetical protein TNCT_41331 [Trichonephila clavata]|uniref:Uncharacterized protein n=1 Tax=Trichonephila clavata TaxID=2740835 RepID=A0A8X6G7D7_TRICU|nr:hypothetical protein TNCT_41331 [Trichonephila clavata]